jgi:hypothetical protein
MDALRTRAVVLAVALVAAACDAPSTVAPTTAARAVPAETGGENRIDWVHGNGPIILRDQCDPATFNIAVGSGDCIAVSTVGRRVPYQDFLAQLETNHNVRGWWINPTLLTTSSRQLTVLNTGGEAHTFTRVTSFGGGVVPMLNELAGTPVEAPECAFSMAQLVRPGNDLILLLSQTPGVLKFQCCIHPWMKMEINSLG